MFVTSRVIHWRETVQLREIPREGYVDGHLEGGCEEGVIALVFAGHGRTNNGGSWTVDLAPISCLAPRPDGTRQPSVVATPTFDASLNAPAVPYLLVARTQGTRIIIRSYTADGQTAVNVEFSWHCMVEVPHV